jgi:hypothetical protein
VAYIYRVAGPGLIIRTDSKTKEEHRITCAKGHEGEIAAALGARPKEKPVTTAQDDLMTIDEVAELTRRPVATLRWWRATGQGPKSGKLGRRVFYRREDVEAWIRSAFE